jgi:hypothetical protein
MPRCSRARAPAATPTTSPTLETSWQCQATEAPTRYVAGCLHVGHCIKCLWDWKVYNNEKVSINQPTLHTPRMYKPRPCRQTSTKMCVLQRTTPASRREPRRAVPFQQNLNYIILTPGKNIWGKATQKWASRKMQPGSLKGKAVTLRIIQRVLNRARSLLSH